MAGEAYFLASDQHFGWPNADDSRARERHFVRWLDAIAPQAKGLYLLGDLFDYWCEYRTVVPRGYVRLLGKLAELRDGGLPITAFAGNHDRWYASYFPQELGIPVHQTPKLATLHGRRFFLAHGDGLGPGDHGYKLAKRVMTNRAAIWAFRNLLHPDWATALATNLSHASRAANAEADAVDHGEREFLLQFARHHQATQGGIDVYAFGHRHLAKRVPLGQSAEMVLLGDWITHFSYLRVGPESLSLEHFPRR